MPVMHDAKDLDLRRRPFWGGRKCKILQLLCLSDYVAWGGAGNSARSQVLLGPLYVASGL